MPHELILYGYVGGADFNAKHVASFLSRVGKKSDIDVRLHTIGGNVFEGVAMFNAFERHEGKVRMFVDGAAFSMGSYLMLAGDERHIADNAMVMSHEPWTRAEGTAGELINAGMVTGKIRDLVTAKYAEKTNQSNEEAAQMLAAETWMTPEEALFFGFATHIAGPQDIDMRFDLSEFESPPEQAVARFDISAAAEPIVKTKEVNKMPAEITASVDEAVPVDKNAIKMEAVATERKRVADIKMVFSNHSGHDDLMNSLIDGDDGPDKARAALLDELGKEVEPTGNIHAVKGEDERDKFRMGVERSLLHRGGVASDESKGIVAERNDFSGLSLLELARMSLRKGGQSDRGTKLEVVGAAFTHSTSDFTNILSNVANKSMLKGFEEVPETFDLWTTKGSLSDFKPTTRVDLGLMDSLPVLAEGAEYKHGTIGDRGETVSLVTYGKMISFTRQTIINDDMDALAKVPSRLGRAAKRTIGDAVYAILTGNPNMSDGVALFHNANHFNDIAGSAITTASLDAMKTKMALQKLDGKVVGVLPTDLICPVGLGGLAKQVITSQTEISSGQNNSKKPNYAPNLRIIEEARLDAASATAFYMAANSAAYDTIEVSYLDGNETPFMDQMNGWNVDGTEMKVRIDFGVKALEWRTFQRNVGA